jgi:hypothetical protein
MFQREANEVILRRERDWRTSRKHLTRIWSQKSVSSIAELVIERLELSLREESGVHEDLKVPLFDDFLHLFGHILAVILELIGERPNFRSPDFEERFRIVTSLGYDLERLKCFIIRARSEKLLLVKLQNG